MYGNLASSIVTKRDRIASEKARQDRIETDCFEATVLRLFNINFSEEC